MLLIYLSLLETAEDKRLFEQIYTEYRQQMFKYACKLLQDEGYAEDVVHNVFLAIIKNGVEKLRKIDNKERLWNYLAVSVRNQCKAFGKKYGAKMAQETPYRDELGGNPAEDRLWSESAYNRLVETIRGMKPAYAEVLYYALVEELKAPQIARLMHLSPGAVRQRISRGKKLLQELLREEIKE